VWKNGVSDEFGGGPAREVPAVGPRGFGVPFPKVGKLTGRATRLIVSISDD
jgi:hypothetical protein